MTPDEKRAYLRNLLIVARADTVVSPEEDTLLARIVAELGVSLELVESVTNRLQGEATAPHPSLSPIQRFSDRVRCLEDMLELSLADGHMAQSEKAVLFEAAHKVEISQHQVMTLIEEAKRRLQRPQP